MSQLTSNEAPPTLHALGEAAFVLGFGSRIEAQVNRRVLDVTSRIGAADIGGVLDLVPAYTTLTVYFDPSLCDRAALARRLLDVAQEPLQVVTQAERLVEIPVCYEPVFAVDMRAVCAHSGLEAAEVIHRHSAVTYRVHFLGFTPGFPYLGGLDPALATPRRATPRLRVPSGSVAIGGAQTGVYPQAAPGGWHIIGRTPLSLFDAGRDPVCLLRAGDSLRFVPIDAPAFARLAEG